MTNLLSTGDVADVVGIPLRLVRGWCDSGLITSDAGGDGPGDHRRFSIMRTVGIAVAAAIKRGEQSCADSYVKMVVEAFASMDEKQLQDEFKKGQTHLVMIHYNKPLLRGAEYDWLDVRAIYLQVTAKIAELERQRPKVAERGRTRGLAKTAETTS
jgi:hypothetical protein